jgi:hypothetical protein
MFLSTPLSPKPLFPTQAEEKGSQIQLSILSLKNPVLRADQGDDFGKINVIKNNAIDLSWGLNPADQGNDCAT